MAEDTTKKLKEIAARSKYENANNDKTVPRIIAEKDVPWLVKRVRALEGALRNVLDCCEAETPGCQRAQSEAEGLLSNGAKR